MRALNRKALAIVVFLLGGVSGLAAPLAPLSPEKLRADGFVSLFDGRTWTGWDHPADLDGRFEIENGAICIRPNQSKRQKGKPYDLATLKSYRDFELLIDWRLTGEPKMKALQVLTDEGLTQLNPEGKILTEPRLNWGNAGIFLRGAASAQVNIWCYPWGSGEVGIKYKDMDTTVEERRKTMPRFRADHGPNEWNRFHITLRGDRVEVILNEMLVVSDARAKPIPATGPLVLQNHNEAAEFRNIYLRELP